ncbi:ABC transporter [Thauera linaloolentis 47Lol = DSM 12138]|uniref:ABC transporter n=1 Tax=Thauera linaloolentis (strain DSM 12138 / JCM 21573 / CCUG 41526 / CIP 105981 / IAM 15112 / NBRC 102519 / 47Lol) TaxID=1123367 RepID=N6Z4K6_THAL4|nr:ABC transporter [Thauera linaloolentis 47Lol = DSM 12138]
MLPGEASPLARQPARPGGLPLRQRAAAVWRLLRPYWVSEDRWRARALLALVIGTDLLRTYVAVRVNYWQRDYWDALAAHDVNAFWQLMWVFLVIICFSSVFDTARIWFFQALEMRWRAWLTEVFVGRWLDGEAYYRIARGGGVDNPDQRIGEDLQIMASDSLRLSLGMLDSLVKLFSYSVIVWSLSGSLSFALGGVGIEIPGYMLWVAVLYALSGSLLLERIGHPLVRVDYHQQRCEAHFRYLMMRVRENAEQIAFYSGGRAESVRLRAAFLAVRENWRRIMDYTKRITLFHESYIEIGAFLPLLIIGPRYFAGEITLGAVQQLTLSFSRVRGALSWFIFAYKDLALLRSVFQRLLEFEAAMARREEGGIARVRGMRPGVLRVSALTLQRPDGTPLACIGDLELRPGERWLVRGHSGAGKSTLLRALAGLWPHGSGEIAMPPGRAMFLPQRSYLPVGSLRACLCYPSDEQWFGVGECLEVLDAAGLGGLAAELEVCDDWAGRLSPGEQQRLAFARLFLHKPDWVFLDESTASLDARNESRLYEALIRRLPGASVVSVGHRAGLERFHAHALEIGADGAACIRPRPEGAQGMNT